MFVSLQKTCILRIKEFMVWNWPSLVSYSQTAQFSHRCRSADVLTVVTGEFDLQKSSGAEQIFGVVNITENGFNTTTSENDIALLTLNGTIKMDNHRQPACLPVPQDQFRPTFSNKPFDVCIALGWGRGSGPGKCTFSTSRNFFFDASSIFSSSPDEPVANGCSSFDPEQPVPRSF